MIANVNSHMTKIAAMPWTKSPMALDLVYSIGDVSPAWFAQMMNLG